MLVGILDPIDAYTDIQFMFLLECRYAGERQPEKKGIKAKRQ